MISILSTDWASISSQLSLIACRRRGSGLRAAGKMTEATGCQARSLPSGERHVGYVFRVRLKGSTSFGYIEYLLRGQRAQ